MSALADKSGWLTNSSIREAICAFALGLFLAFNSSAVADDDKQATPATVAEARQVIDLAAFPLCGKVEGTPTRRLAHLVYRTSGTMNDVFDFQKLNLVALKFEELADSEINDQSASAAFIRGDFLVSVRVSVVDSEMPEVLLVTLTNHGNVNLAKLPVPDGAKNLYTSRLSTAHVTESARSETAQAIRRLLVAQGWQPFGKPAGNWREYKQNAVRLSVSVESDPAQGKKTVIEYTSELMSVDLPISPDFRQAVYTDPIKRLIFLTDQSPEEVVAFYREALGKSGWRSTLDKSTKLRSIEQMVFRNPQQELLILEMETTDNAFLNGRLTYYSAAEVKELSGMQRRGANSLPP